MSLEERVSSVLAAVFNLPVADVGPDARLGELEGWDSLGQVLLLGELERAFSVSFSINEAEELESLKGIVACLRRKHIPE